MLKRTHCFFNIPILLSAIYIKLHVYKLKTFCGLQIPRYIWKFSINLIFETLVPNLLVTLTDVLGDSDA